MNNLNQENSLKLNGLVNNGSRLKLEIDRRIDSSCNVTPAHGKQQQYKPNSLTLGFAPTEDTNFKFLAQISPKYSQFQIDLKQEIARLKEHEKNIRKQNLMSIKTSNHQALIQQTNMVSNIDNTFENDSIQQKIKLLQEYVDSGEQKYKHLKAQMDSEPSLANGV